MKNEQVETEEENTLFLPSSPVGETAQQYPFGNPLTAAGDEGTLRSASDLEKRENTQKKQGKKRC